MNDPGSPGTLAQPGGLTPPLPYVPPVCIWCAADPPLPLVALEDGLPAVWHDAGGGTLHSCARRRGAARIQRGAR